MHGSTIVFPGILTEWLLSVWEWMKPLLLLLWSSPVAQILVYESVESTSDGQVFTRSVKGSKTPLLMNTAPEEDNLGETRPASPTAFLSLLFGYYELFHAAQLPRGLFLLLVGGVYSCSKVFSPLGACLPSNIWLNNGGVSRLATGRRNRTQGRLNIGKRELCHQPIEREGNKHFDITLHCMVKTKEASRR